MRDSDEYSDNLEPLSAAVSSPRPVQMKSCQSLPDSHSDFLLDPEEDVVELSSPREMINKAIITAKKTNDVRFLSNLLNLNLE